jgi:catalase
MVTEGIGRKVFNDLKAAIEKEGAMLEVVAPAVGGVTADDGSVIEAKQKIGGGPSVLYDAVAVLASKKGVADLLTNAAAKDFVSDAFAHLKFVAYSPEAMPLFEKAGIAADMDEGFFALRTTKDSQSFIAACRKLRRWEREQIVKT